MGYWHYGTCHEGVHNFVNPTNLMEWVPYLNLGAWQGSMPVFVKSSKGISAQKASSRCEFLKVRRTDMSQRCNSIYCTR